VFLLMKDCRQTQARGMAVERRAQLGFSSVVSGKEFERGEKRKEEKKRHEKWSERSEHARGRVAQSYGEQLLVCVCLALVMTRRRRVGRKREGRS
jgi:hypothetical protein